MNLASILADVSASSPETIGSIGRDAIAELVARLTSQGRSDLAATVPALERFAVPAATWAAAAANGDPAEVAKANEDLALLAADSIFRAGQAGIQTETIVETEIVDIIARFGRAVLLAALAAA